jgi:hypothetical protein
MEREARLGLDQICEHGVRRDTVPAFEEREAREHSCLDLV